MIRHIVMWRVSGDTPAQGTAIARLHGSQWFQSS